MYDPRGVDNPWFRQGRQAREARAFLESIAFMADRPEEDEDTEVVARPRAAIRAAVEGHDLFEHGLLGACVDYSEIVGEDLDPLTMKPYDPLARAQELREFDYEAEERMLQRAQQEADRRARRKKREADRKGHYKVNAATAVNWPILQRFDQSLYREYGHWQVTEMWSYAPGPQVQDTKGFTRALAWKALAWLVEHGEWRSQWHLKKTCKQGGCVAPAHYERTA